MTTLWQALDDNQQTALTCMLTMTVGLFIGAAVTWWHIRTPQTVTDDLGVTEYEAAHADDVYDWSAVRDEDLAAWERELFGGTA